ncbi:putative nuclease HARBI1, partial [Orchesella cincta]
GFHSLVLMGVADADYKFMYFDVGAYGSEGTVRLDLPPSRIVHGKLIPLYFVADDAFPLAKHIQKPFKPPSKYKTLPEDERIFNYRLSRARRTIENAFGILCVRWLCLARTMFVGPDRAQKVITACCLLHNYLTTVDKNEYVPQGFSDTVLENGSIVDGYWRTRIPPNSMFRDEEGLSSGGRLPENAKLIREHLKNYLNSEQGSLSWQINLFK